MITLSLSLIKNFMSEILILDSQKKITRQVLSHYAISFVISKLQSYGTAFLFKF